MSTKNVTLKEKVNGAAGNVLFPATITPNVYDSAKGQALSQTLVNTPDYEALGFAKFSTASAYSAGDKVYKDNELYRFIADKAAGEWDVAKVEPWSIEQEIEEVDDAIRSLIPAQASADNKLADKAYVNDKVATDTATFRGTFNLVTDLELTTEATQGQIATALGTAISTADNNDYAFVQIPTDASTPTEIARIERYKFNGSDWAFEYELNNSGFTTAQWAAINSGITTEKVAKLDALPTAANLYTKEEVDAMIADIEENYLKKGTYSADTAVGLADNLRGQTVDSDAYLIRPTGGSENEVANGVASVLGMEGNSCVWNQLINDSWSALNNVGTVTVNGKSVICTKTSSSTSTSFLVGNGGIPNSKARSLQGHKIYLEVYVDSMSEDFSSMNLGFMNESYSMVATHLYLTRDKIGSIRGITFTLPDTTYRFGVKFNTSVPQNAWVKFSNVKVIDLTLLGIDAPSTTTIEVRAWLAQHVGTKPYYNYNAGEILSAKTLGIKTYGQNLLNPTTKQAKLIPYTWVENGTDYSNQYTIKNVPSGATATFTPDNTGVAESVTITDDIFDITSYGSGILELSAATANTYVCIRWNGTKDNDVVPYEDHTYDFDVRKVYGKAAGSDTYVQCYPNGMRSADSAHDTLTASEAVVSIGTVNADSLNWTYVTPESGNNYFRASISGRKLTTNEINYICSNYQTVLPIDSTSVQNDLPNKTFSVRKSTTAAQVYLRDNSYTNSDSLIGFLTRNAVKISYELATPITYTDLIYRDGGIDRPLADVLMNIEVNNWSMEEQLMTPYDEQTNQPTSIPATIKTRYGMDAMEAIDTLQKNCYFADDVRENMQALLTCINTNCAETLGGTFAISETATDKVFEFTFTPNTEPDVEPTNEGE